MSPRPKRTGIGAKALREALNGINRVSDERRRRLPHEIERDLREMFPMTRVKESS